MLKQLKSVSMLLFLGCFSTGTMNALPASDASAIVQQNGTCKGVVKDASGESVIGASVVVKGTTNGTITDFDGNFNLSNVKKGDVLVISYVGYQTQELKWNGTDLNVTLKEDSQALSEVVVVGYGVQKKANLSGSVAQVDSETLTNRPISNLSSGIQGLMPGVTVTAGQGRPGADGSTIRIRGVGTLNNSNPYILIDGVESGSMNDLDPNDIESISVLKDASSAAIYGSKASNGVILITTKRGKSGKPQISYNGYVGIQNATSLIERVSSAQYATMFNEIDKSNGNNPRYSEEDIRLFKDGSKPYTHPNTDWNDAAFETGLMHKHNVSVSGGNEGARYMASFGYLGQEGILPNSERSQFNGRINLDLDITKRLKFRTNMSYIKNDYKDPSANYGGDGSDQIIRQLNILSPMIPVKKEDGTYGQTNDGNPIAWLESGQTQDHYKRNFSGLVGLDYKVLDCLTATVNGSFVSNDDRQKTFIKKINNDPAQVNRQSRVYEYFSNEERYTLDVLLNFDKTWGQHNLKALAGYHAEAWDYRFNGMERQNFPNNELDDMNAGAASTQTNSGYTRELNMLSYFGRVNYDFAGKYLLEANFRADASSRFAPGNRWGYFPSFSAAWRISEESFMEQLKESWLSSLKIRASWGQLGNQNALDGSYYPWLNTYNLGADYPFGGSLISGYYQGSYKNIDLSWEKATTWGIGVDFTLFNKLTGSVDFYNRKTTGIIMNVDVPAEFGLGAYQDNIGGMTNKGVEVQLGYTEKINDWTLGVSGNFTYNKNTIDDLGGVDRIPNGSFMREVGSPIDSWYVYRTDGFFQNQAEVDAFEAKYRYDEEGKVKGGFPFSQEIRPGDLRYVDTNGDGKLDAEDRELYKTKNPKFTYGFNVNVGWKNLDLSLNFNGAAGVGYAFTKEAFGEFAGSASHPSTAWLDRWTPENPHASMPRIAEARMSPSEASVMMSDFWIIDTSYLRLKTIQLGYTFPKNWLQKWGIQNLRVYYSAENMLTFDNMPINVDPETVSDRLSSYPLNKTHSFGVNISF